MAEQQVTIDGNTFTRDSDRHNFTHVLAKDGDPVSWHTREDLAQNAFDRQLRNLRGEERDEAASHLQIVAVDGDEQPEEASNGHDTPTDAPALPNASQLPALYAKRSANKARRLKQSALENVRRARKQLKAIEASISDGNLRAGFEGLTHVLAEAETDWRESYIADQVAAEIGQLQETITR